MTRDEALQELEKLQNSGDPEIAHSEADDILCNLLESLGYGDVVAKWETIERWYA